MTSRDTVFYGAVINPVDLTSYQALPHALLAVSSNGEIAWIEEDVESSTLQEVLAAKGWLEADVVELKLGEFLMPGLVDTHTHAPQVPNIASGQQYELLDWLKHVTFPMESKFSDVDFAKRTYERVVPRFINSGTTTCCYYGSLHLESTKVLADIVHARGQRAFIGKCNMNRNCPKHYIEKSTEVSINDTVKLIKHIKHLSSTSAATPTSPYDPIHSLVHPIITPRFAISCTDDLLSALGTLASSDKDLRIQTHISENAGEIAETRRLFPEQASYAAVYDAFGLLRRGTVLAHGVHLSEEEMALIERRGAGVSHCPTSNFNLRSGLAPVGRMLDLGINVGLGTDVSGGFSPSILTAVQHASMCSKTLSFQSATPAKPKPPTSSAPSQPQAQSSSTSNSTFAGKQLPVATLLYLATLGGAHVCALESRIGSFAPGKAFDALVASTRAECGNPAVWGPDVDDALGLVRERGGADGVDETVVENKKQQLESVLERFLFGGDDRNIRRVYVEGRLIGGAAR